VLLAPPSFAAAAACGSPSSTAPAPSAACGAPVRALLAASDYTSSGVGGLLADGGVELRYGADLGGDPQLTVTGGRSFFIARDHDLLFEIDPTCGQPIARLSVRADGDQGSQNPQDVAATSDGTLFVPRYNPGDLFVVDKSGATSVISLASFDADGNPQPSAATTIGAAGAEKVFVALERLDDKTLKSVQQSMVVRIDAKTRSVDGQVTLAGKNPFNLPVVHGGALYYAEPGNFDDMSEAAAGVERLDPQAMTSALLVSEKDLGGSVVMIAIADGCGAAIVANQVSMVNATSLVTFDPDTGKVHASSASSPLATGGFDLAGLTFSNGMLYVGDRRRGDQGYPIHAFAVGAGCTLTALPDAATSPQKPVAVRSVQL
jgi:hypothetical protein